MAPEKLVIMGCYAETLHRRGLVWVIFRDRATGEISMSSIQPEEQSPEMMLLHPVCCVAHESLMRTVEEHYGQEPPR